jgi:hypothetical protein
MLKNDADDLAFLDSIQARAMQGETVQLTWEEAAKLERICLAAGLPSPFGTPAKPEYREKMEAARAKEGVTLRMAPAVLHNVRDIAGLCTTYNVDEIAGRIKDLLGDGDQHAALVSLLREAPSTFTLTGLVYAMDGIRPNPGYEHLGDTAGVAPKIKRLMAERDQFVAFGSALLESPINTTLVELADALTGTGQHGEVLTHP